MVPDCVLQVEAKLRVDTCQFGSNERIVRIETGLKSADFDQYSCHVLKILHSQLKDLLCGLEVIF